MAPWRGMLGYTTQCKEHPNLPAPIAMVRAMGGRACCTSGKCAGEATGTQARRRGRSVRAAVKRSKAFTARASRPMAALETVQGV